MNNNANNVIVPLIPINNIVVKGYGGLIKVRGEGTIKYKIEDSNGKIYSVIIKNVKYGPEAPICLKYP